MIEEQPTSSHHSGNIQPSKEMMDTQKIPPPSGRPTGTVTFLFTDIEGSTRLWETHPDLMPRAFARHEAIIRETVATHGGYAYKMIGDAFQVAFQSAPAALQAAVAIQQAFTAEPWGDSGTLKVRVALHTGSVEERGDDYVGPLLNRVARLMAAGHGGQILLSEITAALMRASLPQGVELLDLGEHRLKDLAQPERLFQISSPGIPRDFPRLNSLDTARHNLPVQATLFIGRANEVQAIGSLISHPDVRLVTLTGPGGTGKTRLALEAAVRLVDHFMDGVWFVPLAPVSDPTLVLSVIAGTLGVRESSGFTLVESILAHLGDKSTLLLLDNLEQIISAAPEVAALLSGAPGLKLLVTSRELLRVYGEFEYCVPSLTLPDLTHLPAPDLLAHVEAITLFLRRAEAAKQDFRLTGENAAAIAEICARLDGLPLAIELAAARVKLFAPQALLTRLKRRLRLLTGGARDLPARQQSLRGAIDWSYDLLAPAEKQLFITLSVFVGGWTLEAAEALFQGGDLPHEELFDTLIALIEKSLVRQYEETDGTPRFFMLQTIREYADERLEESEHAEEIRQRHADYYGTLVEPLEPLRLVEMPPELLIVPASDHDNLRAALRWAISRNAQPLALRLAVGIAKIGWHFGMWREAIDWLDQVTPLCDGLVTPLAAKAYSDSGTLRYHIGEYEQAVSYHQKAVELYRELGDRANEVFSLGNIGSQYYHLGEYEQATRYLEGGLELSRTVSDWWVITLLLIDAGELARCVGDYALAKSYAVEASEMARLHDDTNSLTNILQNQANILLRMGDESGAAELLTERLQYTHSLHSHDVVVVGLVAQAGVHAQRGEPVEALRLLGAAASLCERVGFPLEAPDQMDHDWYLTMARAQLPEAEADRAWNEGAAMDQDGALTYARKLLGF